MVRSWVSGVGIGCLTVATAGAYLAPAAIPLGSAVGHTAYHFVEEARAHARWAGTHDLAVAARALEAGTSTPTTASDSVDLHTHGPGSAPHSHSVVVDALLTAADGEHGALTAGPSPPTWVGHHVPPPAPRLDVVPERPAAQIGMPALPPALWLTPPSPPPPKV